MSVTATYELHLGVDASKGYADLHLMNAAGAPAGLVGRFDDTPDGHAAIRRALGTVLERLGARGLQPQLSIGVEASGGLERNWLRLFLGLTAATGFHVYQLNPLAVKRFRAQQLHYSSTDALSAQAIAEYLRRGLRAADVPYTAAEEGALVFLRGIEEAQQQLTRLKNQLQCLLPSVQPDLVQFCRQKLPEWVLTVLTRYPTATRLAAARPATLAKIAYVTPERAAALITAAQQSVAALRDGLTGERVADLVRDIRQLEREIARRKEKLCRTVQDDPVVKLLVSLPGVGPWTATVLRLELGPLARFPTAKAIVAFAGLDPAYFQSGDGRVEWHISKRGRGQIRAALWMSARSGIRWNPVLKAYYAHLVARGKRGDVALVACAAKLLRIAYACVVSEKPFDPDYEAMLRQKRTQATSIPSGDQAPELAIPAANVPAAATAAAASGCAVATVTRSAVSAPVSRREAQRRKTVATASSGEAPSKPVSPGATARETAPGRSRSA